MITEDYVVACRTCGVFCLYDLVRPIFTAPVDDPVMHEIRYKLSTWELKINENDGHSQYICNSCVYQFQNMFKFRCNCLRVQLQFREQYMLRQQNLMELSIKREIDESECGVSSELFKFSDNTENECAGTTNHTPHVSIKVEPNLETESNSNIDYSQKIEDSKYAVSNNIYDPIESVPSDYQLQWGVSLETQTENKQPKEYFSKKRVKYLSKRQQNRLKLGCIMKPRKCLLCGFSHTSRAILNKHMRFLYSKYSCNRHGKSVCHKRVDRHTMQRQCIESKMKNDSCQQFTQFSGMELSVNSDAMEASVSTTSEQKSIYSDYDDASKVFYCHQLNDCTDNLSTDGSYDDTMEPVTHQFICATCGKSFRTMHKLSSHNLDHKNGSGYSCQICGKKFFLKFALKMHLKKHVMSFN